jgi:hypothetical protein
MKSKLTEPPKNKQNALAAPIGVTEPLDSPSRKDRLDVIPQERKRPAASPVFSIKPSSERASVTTPSLQELYGQRCDAYLHWGLNE